MLQLIKTLLFGKQCSHEWEYYSSVISYNNEKRTYICKHCMKIKTAKIPR